MKNSVGNGGERDGDVTGRKKNERVRGRSTREGKCRKRVQKNRKGTRNIH
jgi:hypothetical protein